MGDFELDVSEKNTPENDMSFKLSYGVFKECFNESFENAKQIDKKLFTPITFKSKIFQRYLERFNFEHYDLLSARSQVIKELFLLYHTSKSLYKYNDDVLKMPHIQFRSHFYFPNIIYLLIRYLPEVRVFLQKTIKSAYYLIQKKNARLIKLFESAIYSDHDVIKTDILYSFLGNSIKKINPFEINNINVFYRQVFLNHFFYYFKSEQKIHSTVIDEWTNLDVVETRAAPTREGLYKDILTTLQVEDFKEDSPTMRQLHYNYNIFKNVIIGNEFQSVFLTSRSPNDTTVFCNLNNSQYKVLSFYHKLLTNEEFITELKKIPLIYRLLKSVHLVTRNSSIKLTTIRKEVLVSAVADELAYPFRNMLNSDISLRTILTNIAENFVSSILAGEYISLQTLSPIKLDQMSFVMQLRKFIKLCISNNNYSEIR